MDRVERGILSLTSRIVDRVESRVLGVMLVKIIAKLQEALKSPFVKRMETYGVDRAGKIAEQAVEWGYWEARGWVMDMGFSGYLTILDFNKPSGWGF
ncbi:MAG: hypothetical protein ACTSQY_02550 [Candidatus Odinarchaeia archaeon]